MMKETPRTQPSAIAVEQERSDEERGKRRRGGGGGRRESWINERGIQEWKTEGSGFFGGRW